jgi:hypothetical protein
MIGKYRYVFKHKESNGFRYLAFTIDDIQSGETQKSIDLMDKVGFTLIARDMYTGLKTFNKEEIYENDILKGTSYLYGYDLTNGKQFDYYGYVEWQSQCDVGLCWVLSDNSGSWSLKQTVHRNMIDYCTGELLGNMHEKPDEFKI